MARWQRATALGRIKTEGRVLLTHQQGVSPDSEDPAVERLWRRGRCYLGSGPRPLYRPSVCVTLGSRTGSIGAARLAAHRREKLRERDLVALHLRLAGTPPFRGQRTDWPDLGGAAVEVTLAVPHGGGNCLAGRAVDEEDGAPEPRELRHLGDDSRLEVTDALFDLCGIAAQGGKPHP